MSTGEDKDVFPFDIDEKEWEELRAKRVVTKFDPSQFEYENCIFEEEIKIIGAPKGIDQIIFY